MAEPLPALILTGASGFIGRAFLLAAREHYRIYAIARRSQQESEVPKHPNIEWIQVDIGNAEAIDRVTTRIERNGGADYSLHLAAHYDFGNKDRPEYLHTNVLGTRHVLEQAKRLGVKRFIFASSAAACPVPSPGCAITEETPPDAEFPYARSKKVGESMTQDYSEYFPCSVVRLAAVFSDCCEYAPLYVFLSTWLSKRWNARILGGRGTSGVSYIHVRDVCRLFLKLLQDDALPRFAVYLASPDGATSHKDLFQLATRFRFGRVHKPILIPKAVATVGVVLRDLLGRLLGRRPFERLWMMQYVDRPLTVDSSSTRKALSWAPAPRRLLTRRMLFLIERMKGDPLGWSLVNERALKRIHERPALVVHDSMMRAEDLIADHVTDHLLSPDHGERFPHYGTMSRDELRWSIGLACGLLRGAVRTSDRASLLQYLQLLACRRYLAGFPASELCNALLVMSEKTLERVLLDPQVAAIEEQARDAVNLTIALAIDGVQDAYEAFAEQEGPTPCEAAPALGEKRTLDEIVKRLNAFYRPPGESSQATHSPDPTG